jgi:hypothetical protein
MNNNFSKNITIELILILISFVFVFLIFTESNEMDKNFQDFERRWDSLDRVIDGYQIKINEMDSINKQLSKDIASFDEYR